MNVVSVVCYVGQYGSLMVQSTKYSMFRHRLVFIFFPFPFSFGLFIFLFNAMCFLWKMSYLQSALYMVSWTSIHVERTGGCPSKKIKCQKENFFRVLITFYNVSPKNEINNNKKKLKFSPPQLIQYIVAPPVLVYLISVFGDQIYNCQKSIAKKGFFLEW